MFWTDENEKRLAAKSEVLANRENGWEALATALRERFGIVVLSEEQANREADKLEEGKHAQR